MRFYRFCIPRRKERLVFIVILLVGFCGLSFYAPSLLHSNNDDHSHKGVVNGRYQVERVNGQARADEDIKIHRPVPPRQLPDQPKPDPSAPGEGGKAVRLTDPKEIELGKQQMKTWFMNLVAIDKISMDRSLPDVRSSQCAAITYDRSTLPSASVVIIFTNEAWTPLLRTVHSVINRTPPNLLHEVVLLDDASDREELGSKLTEYVTRWGGRVRLERRRKRLGLIGARMEGARAATGDVLVFLDSHCEVTDGWLEPLVQRIKDSDGKAVVCPTIDGIDANSGSYGGGGGGSTVGGFWWSLHFRWDAAASAVLAKRASRTDALPSPTMPGGLFAADRKQFFALGGYDEGMEIWGGENLEISFRTWMCGGSVEFIPCSHVGHIFRSGHPYNMTTKDVHGFNSVRLAEVWMDDYKRLYYMHRKDLEKRVDEAGDLTSRKKLRQDLKCHDFKWYLDNVNPEKFIMDENVLGFGYLRNVATGLCLDLMQRDEKSTFNVGVFSCQSGGSANQVFSLTPAGQFRRDKGCTTAPTRSSTGPVALSFSPSCRASFRDPSPSPAEHFTMPQGNNGPLRHEATKYCLDAADLKSGEDAQMRPCEDPLPATQTWQFERWTGT